MLTVERIDVLLYRIRGDRGRHYGWERALGRLHRLVGAEIQRTGNSGDVFLRFPEFSKATGVPCSTLNEAMVQNFIEAA